MKKKIFWAKHWLIFKKKKGLFGTKKQAGAELKKKKKDFLPQKLNNFQKKKKGHFWPKNKQGLSLRTKKEFFGQKIYQFKKKDFSGQKNKLGLSLRRKKGFFAPKIDQFSKKEKKEKGTFWAKTNKLGLSLRRRGKKRFFGPKIVKKIEFKGQKLTHA